MSSWDKKGSSRKSGAIPKKVLQEVQQAAIEAARKRGEKCA